MLRDDRHELNEEQMFQTKLNRELYYKYFTVPILPKKFFQIGRLFMTLWTEPYLADDLPPSRNPHYTRIVFDKFAYHKLRTFVIVEERHDQMFSYC